MRVSYLDISTIQVAIIWIKMMENTDNRVINYSDVKVTAMFLVVKQCTLHRTSVYADSYVQLQFLRIRKEPSE